MRSYSLDLDMLTGDILAIGKDGRRYTFEQIRRAETAASRGDPDAAALLLAVDHGLDADGNRMTPEEVRTRFEQLIHDCPECQAARARGEQPLRWPPPPPDGPRPTNSHARRRERERRRRRSN